MKTKKPRLIDKLDKRHRDATILKFSGMSHRMIASELKAKRQTVDEWFMWNGICKPAYDELIKIDMVNSRRRVSRAMEELESLVPHAIDALRKAVVVGQWEAALSVLDRTGYGATSKIETNQPLTKLIIEVVHYHGDENEGDPGVHEDTGSVPEV